ncbi:LysR family transcriptional regulator [Massilia arenosa]|uniref:LysR family transcriptional regulator n=1 Tax=Zemynaea arenosa TaxID=2561931 RepID=A0A4Y9S038_9BURK|nr:LysR family transcriptional regulator [Massilia arenosa]TFW14857.1 LysR family transcriptional regulator [Massilia arenosa]
MTFTQLDIFILVADLGGFTAAAQRLGISQSAVSHAIKSLEKELGVELVVRQQGAVELTDVGQRMLARTREITGLTDAMRQEAAAARGMNSGVVRIGSFGPTASLRLLPAILKAFHARYPGIEVQIDEGTDDEVRQWLLERRVDAGFIVLPNESFDTVPLAEDQLLALVPRTHRLAQRQFIAPTDLAGEGFIMSEACCGPLVEPEFARHGVPLHIRYRMSQVLTILGLVGAGDGVSVMPELALPMDLARSHPDVVVIPFRPAIRRRVGLGLRNLARASPAARAFVDIARKAARSLEERKAA